MLKNMLRPCGKYFSKKKSDDYVIATNKSTTVKQFINIVFKNLGINIAWKGKKLNEVGYDKRTKNILIKVNKKYFRPLEVDFLKGDYSKAEKKIGWTPKTNLEKLVKIMINEELKS